MSMEDNALSSSTESSVQDLYLDLMKRTLTRYAFPERFSPIRPLKGSLAYRLNQVIQAVAGARNLELVRRVAFDQEIRASGGDWPSEAETMIGLNRLDNLQSCIEMVLADDVPGDIIETGVWRGGAVIFAKAVLTAYGDTSRQVWVADSFEGLPPPRPSLYPSDAGDLHYTRSELAISQDTVKANFERYGLWDDRIRFLAGWFHETLPLAPIERLAVLRLDGDMYESTAVALENLYSKLSPGGFAIIDDYDLPGARAAVTDFRASHGIEEPVIDIDGQGVFWRRDF